MSYSAAAQGLQHHMGNMTNEQPLFVTISERSDVIDGDGEFELVDDEVDHIQISVMKNTVSRF